MNAVTKFIVYSVSITLKLKVQVLILKLQKIGGIMEKRATYEKASWLFFGIGILAVLISVLLPQSVVSSFETLKPAGFTTLFFAPTVGFVGCILGIVAKKILPALLNLLLIFSFPIVMFLGTLLLGP